MVSGIEEKWGLEGVPGSMIEHPALVKRLTKAVVEVCIG
jgi:hypothetical protein